MDVINNVATIAHRIVTPPAKEPVTLVVLEHVKEHAKHHQHHQHAKAIVVKLIVL